MKRKRPPEELNIFGYLDYDQKIEAARRENEDPVEREKKGFEYCGMYVVGSTVNDFKRLLEEVGWMKF